MTDFETEFRHLFVKALNYAMENEIEYFWDAYYIVQQLIVENSHLFNER